MAEVEDRVKTNIGMALYSYSSIKLWPYILLALYSHGQGRRSGQNKCSNGSIELWPYTVMALYDYGRGRRSGRNQSSYGPIQCWPYRVMAEVEDQLKANIVMAYIVMALHSYGPIQVWPCTVIALYSHRRGRRSGQNKCSYGPI